MTQTIKVSKAGIDVLGTAGTVSNNLIFDSMLNTFKIVASGTALGTISSSSTGTVTMAHSLSFTPSVTGFTKVTSGTVVIGNSGSVPLTYGNFKLSSVYADGTNVYMVIDNTGFTTGTFSAKYYAFEPPLI